MPLFQIEDAETLTPEALVIMQARMRRHRRWAAGAVALGILGVVAARPVAHGVKDWQARRLAAEALTLIERQQWQAARDRAADAYALWPTEPGAIRAIARLLERTRNPEALRYYRQLRDQDALTTQDRRDFADIALTAGAAGDAAGQTDWLLAHDRPAGAKTPPPGDLLLAAQVASASGDDQAALALSRRVLNDPAAPEQAQFTAIIRLVNAAAIYSDPNGPELAPIWERVRRLADSQGPVGLQALTVLSHRPAPASNAPARPGWMAPLDIARALDAHPLAGVPAHLLASDLVTRGDPAASASAADAAVARWRGADDAGLEALAGWLLAKGYADRTLEVLPAERVRRHATLFSRRLDALAQLNRWAEIQAALSGENALDPVEQHMYLAAADMHLQDAHAAAGEWRLALEVAGRDPGRLYSLGQYAEQTASPDTAEAAYAAAIAVAPRMRSAHEALCRVTDAHGQTDEARAALAAMLEVWPQDDEARDLAGYFRLLLGASGADARGIESDAATLAKREPGNWQARATLSLAHLRQGQGDSALQAFAGLRAANGGSVPPGALAVRAAALAAAGWKEEARSDARALATATLRPEERALIAPLLAE